jgi:hypothetical protein
MHIGPDLWSMVTAVIIFLLFSQLIRMSISGARSYWAKGKPEKIVKIISIYTG